MTSRMSVSMTLDAVRNRTKTVTRRHVDSWVDLAVGDPLLLVEKGMGLPKGAKQVVVAEVEIVAVDVRPLWPISWAEIVAEGLWDDARRACNWVTPGLVNPGQMLSADDLGVTEDNLPRGMLSPSRWFCSFWMAGHKHKATDDPATVQCRRIEWRYTDG